MFPATGSTMTQAISRPTREKVSCTWARSLNARVMVCSARAAGTPAREGDKVDKDEGVGSGNSSASSSIHYIHGVDDPAKNPLSGTVIHSEGHPIVEPQPVYPTGQMVNNDYEYQNSLSQTGQGIALPESAAGAVPSSFNQSISQSAQSQTNGTSTHMQSLVGQNGVNLQGTLQQSDTPVQNQDFMTRSQEFVAAQPQDFIVQGQAVAEISGQNANAQAVQISQTQLPNQPDSVVLPVQNSTLAPEYSNQQGQTNASNVAQNAASPSNDNLNVQSGEVAVQDSSFSKSVEDIAASGHVETAVAVKEADAEADKAMAADGVLGVSTATPASAASGLPLTVAGTAQDLLTPPLLEMVSATMQQPGGITLSKDNGDER